MKWNYKKNGQELEGIRISRKIPVMHCIQCVIDLLIEFHKYIFCVFPLPNPLPNLYILCDSSTLCFHCVSHCFCVQDVHRDIDTVLMKDKTAILPVEWHLERMMRIIIGHRRRIYDVRPQCLETLLLGQKNIAAVESTHLFIHTD